VDPATTSILREFDAGGLESLANSFKRTRLHPRHTINRFATADGVVRNARSACQLGSTPANSARAARICSPVGIV
jgi:hypothetical protein